MGQQFDIATLEQGDWAAVREIYAEGLATGLAAFMTSPPLWKSWDARQLAIGRFVARSRRTVIGWAALAPVADS